MTNNPTFILSNLKQENLLNSELSEVNVLPNLPTINGTTNFEMIDFGFNIGQEITNYFLKDDILIIDDLEYFDAAKQKESFLCRICLSFGKMTEAKLKNILRLESSHCFQCCQLHPKSTNITEFDLNQCEIINDSLFFNGLEFIDPHHKQQTYYCVNCLPFLKVTKLNNVMSVKITSDHCQQCYQKRGNIPKIIPTAVAVVNVAAVATIPEQFDTNRPPTSTSVFSNSDSNFIDDEPRTSQDLTLNCPTSSNPPTKIKTGFRKSDNRNTIIEFYQNNFEAVNNFYESLKPEKPLIFNQKNVHEEFSTQLQRSSLYLVYVKCSNIDLVQLAEKHFRKFLCNLIEKSVADNAYETTTTAFQALKVIMDEMMGNYSTVYKLEYYRRIITENVRKRSGRRDINSKVKKIKKRTPEEQARIEELTKQVEEMKDELLQINNSEMRKKIYSNEKYTNLRYSWLTEYIGNRRPGDTIYTTLFLDTFFEMIIDPSFLHADYLHNLKIKHNIVPIAEISIEFRNLIPAIIELAHDKQLTDSLVPEDSYEKELYAGRLLRLLLEEFTPSLKKIHPDAIIIDRPDFQSIDQVANDLEQTIYPRLCIISNSLYIITNNRILPIHGSFGDALQCVFEFHYALDLPFRDSEVFYEFFQKLVGIPKLRYHTTVNAFETALNCIKVKLSQRF